VAAPARAIFIIRHGEKPDLPTAAGDDVFGKPNVHSLIPRGWHRAAALETLFAPSKGPVLSGLLTPTALIAPGYGDEKKDIEHRTHQTILPLARLLGLDIETQGKTKDGETIDFKEGNEAAVGQFVSDETDGVTLICWEHKAIPTIAANIRVPDSTKIPKHWPGSRFDVVFSFTRDSDSDPYTFAQVMQELFPDDKTAPITDADAALDP
jgi:hypothetical protein